jgi:copper chaperone
MTEREFRISGMTCHHCVMAVKRELGKITGLEVKDVRIGTAQVAYDESKVDPARIREAVAEAGYTLVG